MKCIKEGQNKGEITENTETGNEQEDLGELEEDHKEKRSQGTSAINRGRPEAMSRSEWEAEKGGREKRKVRILAKGKSLRGD